MSYYKTCTAPLAIAIALIATPALAQTEAGKVSISISGGTDFPIGGTMHDGANAPIANLGTLNPALAGVSATLEIERRTHAEVFGQSWSVGGEIGYGISDTGEVLLGLRYLQATGNRINVGGAAVGAPVNATLPIFGDFSDYKAFSIELGYRQYFGSGEGMKPFVAARAGATRISAIDADFTIPAAPITLSNVPFSSSSWVFSAGGDIGISIPLGTGVTLEPEVGIRYIDGAKGNDTGLGGLGLGAINNKGERWSVPVSARLKFTM